MVTRSASCWRPRTREFSTGCRRTSRCCQCSRLRRTDSGAAPNRDQPDVARSPEAPRIEGECRKLTDAGEDHQSAASVGALTIRFIASAALLRAQRAILPLPKTPKRTSVAYYVWENNALASPCSHWSNRLP